MDEEGLRNMIFFIDALVCAHIFSLESQKASHRHKTQNPAHLPAKAKTQAALPLLNRAVGSRFCVHLWHFS